MTDSQGDDGGTETPVADGSGVVDGSSEGGIGRALASMAVGVVVGAALAWGVVRVGGVAVPMQVGVGLGAALGGGLGTVAYLSARPEAGDEGVETVSVSGDRTTDTDAGLDTADDLFDAHPDPTLYFTGRDADVLVMAANPAFEETFGVSAGMLVETPLDEVTMTDQLDGLASRLADGETTDETVTCETVSGESTFRVRTVRLADERPQGFLVYTPVGDAGEMGDRESDRVEELAGVVSHELRNPLDSARTRIEVARDTGDMDHLDTALRNVDRMSGIISDLTTLAREGRLIDDREPIDLAATVEEAWETVDADAGTLSVEGDLGRVRADDSALEHLFENLLRNALDHTDGPVTVTVGRLDDSGGFFVADDGPGVPGDERDRVFETGYTTDREGTGLGLSIVERVAEAHGWSVAVTESESGGARFEVTGTGPVSR